MKKIIYTFFLLFLPILANADTVEINGIFYTINKSSQQAEVTTNPDYYQGNFIIPESFEYEGITYNVKSIGYMAFSNCIDLYSVTIPNSVTSIGDSAFWNCSLTTITIPNSVLSIGENAFSGTLYSSGITSVYISDLEAWCKIAFANERSNPLFTAHRLFLNGKIIKDLVIPNSVTSIGDFAFVNCSSLTSVTIPNSVTHIGNLAFYCCYDLNSVTMSNNLTTIGNAAFWYCSNLISITIPNSVKSIGDSTFENCSKLTSVHISDLESWCKISFANEYSNPLCYAKNLYLDKIKIQDLVIPNSVSSIGDYAFWNCKISSVTIPNSVTDIGKYAFYCCDSLISLNIPNSVTSINVGAFRACTSLTSVTIPNSVTLIDSYLFDYCTNLISVTIPNSVTTIGWYAFRDCTSLTSVNIPNSVTSIGWYAFQNCTSLTSVTIPNSVTTIERQAFYDCSGLTSITIGSGIKQIDRFVFANCPKLNDVYCYAESIPSTEITAFSHSDMKRATLHVLPDQLFFYKEYSPWKEFRNIVSLTESDPQPNEIKSVKAVDNDKGFSFDLNGRKVNQPSKGLYIKYGKKYVMK